HHLLHHAPAGSVADVDHRVGAVVHRDVLELPVEELAVKRLRLGDIGGVEFDMHEGIGHDVAPWCGLTVEFNHPYLEHSTQEMQNCDSKVSVNRRTSDSGRWLIPAASLLPPPVSKLRQKS